LWVVGGEAGHHHLTRSKLKNIHIFIINVKDYINCFNVNKMCVTSLDVDIFENYTYFKKQNQGFVVDFQDGTRMFNIS
jgi:hypothetical protein